MALSKIDADSIDVTVAQGSVFFLSKQTVDADFLVPANYNAVSAGPIEITTGVTVELSADSEWTIV